MYLAAALFLEQLEDRRLLATFDVLNTNDSGAGSLRQAIFDANVNLGGDIIQFDSGVTGTISLTSGELAITDAVDLQGPGSGVVTVSGNNASRVFYVTANATISGLTISGGSSTNGGGIYNAYGTLTVDSSVLSGNAALVRGGGIYNAHGALTVDNCTFSGNSASGGGYDGGGGIFNANYGTQTVVHNSTFSGNSATHYGGGIYNEGTLIVDSSTLSGNAGGGSGYGGGGIYNVGTMTVSNTTLNVNTAVSFGGGINNYGTLTVDNSTLSGNSAYDGGGIHNDGTLTVRNSNFNGNSASQNGGGIANRSGTLTVDNSTLSGNSAGFGAGINIGQYNTATVHNSTFSGNSAGNTGGGIFLNGSSTLTVSNSTFSGNNGGGTGGGIASGWSGYTGGMLTVHNSTFSGNLAGLGGGIYNNGTLTVHNSTLSTNLHFYGGGGLYTRGASTLNNTIVAANFTVAGNPDDLDGAVASSSSHNLIGVDLNLSGISNGTSGNQIGTLAAPINPLLGALQNNGWPTKTMALLPGSPAINAGNNSLIPAGTSTDQRGTGYARIENATVDIGAYEFVVDYVPSTFIVNTLADTVDADTAVTSLREAILNANANLGADTIQFAAGLAGTITLTSGELAITDASLDIQGPGSSVITVNGNNASRVFYVTANAIISGLTISGGSSMNGGGIYNSYGTLTVASSTLSGNSAGTGGGIYNAYGALTVDNSTLSGNAASDGGYLGGGGIYNANYGTQTVVRNSALSGNSATNYGGGILNYGTLRVDSGSTLSGNSAFLGGGIFNWLGATATVDNSTLSGNAAGGVGGSYGAGGGIYNFSTLRVDSSTLSGNSAAYEGGGIYNRGEGTVTVESSTFSGNSGFYYGGGILNFGTLTVDGSTFSGNSAGALGGGIYNYSGSGTATVQNSTLSANTASTGGGIFNGNSATLTVDSSTLSGNNGRGEGGGIANGWPGNGGTVAVQNSTLNGNLAGLGGGIYNYGTLTVDNSTLSGNRDFYGGGGLYTRGASTLNNTIVSANFTVAGNPDDLDGAVASSSTSNLIGVDLNLSGISHGNNGNQVGTVAAPINPLLGALQNNGGPTQTMTLLLGSPAINAGNNSVIPLGVSTDQRGTGYTRIDSGTVDIGAFELVLNLPPVAIAGGPYSIAEGSSLLLNGSGSYDPDPLDTLTYSWDVNGDGVFGDASGVSPTLTWTQLQVLGINDGPRMVSNVRVRVDDAHAHVVDSPATTITVSNVAPHDVSIAASVGELVFAVGSSQSFSGSFMDVGTNDTHNAVWTFSHINAAGAIVTETRVGTVTQGSGSGTVSNSFSFTEAGVYQATLTVTDDDTGATSSATSLFVVYDPSAGFVTGGGWINSPAGAYAANPLLTGKANFGFNSKYQNGNNVPTGNTEFQFKVADFNFKSSSYEWLVVSGAKARFRGVGTVSGVGGYGFELTAWDGQFNGGGGVDRFRIKIWFGNQGNGVVYDNMMGASDGADPTTALGGGSVVIHKQGQNLVLNAPEISTPGSPARGDDSQLATAWAEALSVWSGQNLNSLQSQRLQDLNVVWANLPANTLGLASELTNYVWIDSDAAGYGWSFGSPDPQAGRVDLLSTLSHELGHILGYDHGVLGDSLQIGERQFALPSEYRGRDVWALSTPLIQDVGSLGCTLRLSSQSARDELLDGVLGRRLSLASIDLRDQVLADWSTSCSRTNGPVKHQTADTGRRLVDREGRSVEADELLDDELLKELALAFHK